MPIQLSGSLVITGSITTTGVITMSGSIASASYSSNSDLLQGTGSVGFATTASFNAVSSSQQQISSSYIALSASYNTFSGSASTRVTKIENNYATTGSNSFRADQSITGSLVVSSTITAQTLVVQTVTSSIVYSSGSNIFGNQLANTQTFTGSVNITGSLALAGNITSNGTAVVLGSGTSNYLPKFTGTSTIGDSIISESTSTIAINGTKKLFLRTNQSGTGGLLAGSALAAEGNFSIYSDSGVAGEVLGMYYWNGSGYKSSLQVANVSSGNSNLILMKDGGNLGLGVTPSAWYSTGYNIKALQIGSAGALFNLDVTSSNLRLYLASNSYVEPTSAAQTYIVTGAATSFSQENGAFFFRQAASGTAGTAITFTTPLTIASTGAATFSSNIAIAGQTLSAWGGTFGVMQSYYGSYFGGTSGGGTVMGNNNYYNGTSYIYQNSDYATQYQQASGTHFWRIAPSGTAGAAITFTQAMTLDASGNLGLNFTPSASGTNTRALQLTNYGTLSGNGNIGSMSMAANAYESADNSWNRVNATSAGLYQISYTGQHSWYYTGVSTANSAITWTQAMTFFNTGNLAIATTTDSGYKLDVNGTGRFSTIRANYFDIPSGTGFNAFQVGADTFSGGWYVYDSTNSSYRFKIANSGAATFSSGIAIGGATATTGGIQFPATAVAIADANNLDDYEEGTFTPTLGGTSTYTTQFGNYTKIGNKVFFKIFLTVNIIGTGDAQNISGLPFTCDSTITGYSIYVGAFQDLSAAKVFMAGRVGASGTTIAIRSMAAAAVGVAAGNVFQNGTTIEIGGFYGV